MCEVDPVVEVVTIIYIAVGEMERWGVVDKRGVFLWLDANHQRLDYENFIDDDEVTLHRRKKDTDVTDIPGPDARDDLDTQPEDWLLRTEYLHGARPR